ncbi:MAG: hypothetical protein DRP11_03960 [Candidatus Aenigmatarchaeota archaeon]|nr:MAG: hypothetical protein DRP11_03960 [Candidatus Aenigmarchaeota archaeon]
MFAWIDSQQLYCVGVIAETIWILIPFQTNVLWKTQQAEAEFHKLNQGHPGSGTVRCSILLVQTSHKILLRRFRWQGNLQALSEFPNLYWRFS